ncbi:MAG: lipocalin family protein [Bacteroidales bacterium]|nr:lipocalin family protein [Bacteroidales bacterium]
MKKFFLFLSGLSIFGFFGCSSTRPIDNEAVKQLDLQQYVGHWFEIARFDHSFERGLVGCMADYSINDDGTIKVINSGRQRALSGPYKQKEGKARRPDASQPGRLEVSFFLNFYSQYNVLELADDYRYALVGSENDKYLWILSRTPQMQQADIDFLLQSATRRGYDTSKLVWVEHVIEEPLLN